MPGNDEDGRELDDNRMVGVYCLLTLSTWKVGVGLMKKNNYVIDVVVEVVSEVVVGKESELRVQIEERIDSGSRIQVSHIHHQRQKD